MTWPVLQIGSRGTEVGNLQRFLNTGLFFDASGSLLSVDENFGPKTSQAVRAWQNRNGLHPTGSVGTVERSKLRRQGFIPFLRARFFSQGRAGSSIDWIVIHTAESSEKAGSAENVGAWFQDERSKASAHYGIDEGGIVQYVSEADRAWHAPGANERGIGIELCGRADQTPRDWADASSLRILELGSALCAQICIRWGIPVRRLFAGNLLEPKVKGFTGHVEATLAFSHGKGHHDPGVSFPWDAFLKAVELQSRPR